MVMLSESVVSLASARPDIELGHMQAHVASYDLSESVRWDRLCATHPDASVFHSADWIKLLGGTYRLQPICLIVSQPEVGRAIVPMLEVKSLGAARAVSLPFTDFCEPLLTGEANASWLWQNLLELGQARGWRSVELRGGKSPSETESASASFYGHVLALCPQTDRLAERFSPAVRRAIRKAEREGVVVERSDSLEGMRAYYRLHCRTRQRHGLPPQPWRFFENLHRQFEGAENRGLFLARHGDRTIAGAVFLKYGEKALFKFGASDRAHQELRANDLVMWKAIQHFSSVGCASLHFGRTSLANSGLRRFKLGWGVEEHVIEYFRYDLGQAAFVKDRDKAVGWHNRVFRVLPVWMGRAAGSLLYRRFA